MMYDLILQGGVLVDGSGNPPYCADLAVKDGKIAAIGACEAEAAQVINARSYFVTPGFWIFTATGMRRFSGPVLVNWSCIRV